MVLFQDLPLELHIEIWSYLDNPENLSLTCKKLLEVSRSKYVRLAYFLAKGPKQALFAALCRPNIFDEDLFGQLLARGAILPRNLAQELLIRFGLSGNDRFDPVSRHAWSMGLPPIAVLAVIREGYRQYGDWDMRTTDNQKYLQWLECDGSMPNGPVKKLFEDYAFTLLPFSRNPARIGVRSGERYCNVNLGVTASKAIKLDPTLAGILFDSGHDIAEYEKEDTIEHFFNHAGKLGLATLTSNLRTLLKDERLGFSVSEQMAKSVVLGLKHVDQPMNHTDQDRLPISTTATYAWKALKSLESEGLLKGINLPQTIKDLAKTISKEADSAEWRSLQRELCQDCPYVRVFFAKGRWLQEFIDHQTARSAAPVSDSFDAKKKWQKALSDVTTIVRARKALCGATVTQTDIVQVFMRTQMSTDTLPLMYADAYLNVQDWKSFTTKLIRHLLCQVYKGHTLIALKEWFDCTGKVDFCDLLSKEVQRYDVVQEKSMPSMTWKLEYGKHWRYYVPEAWESTCQREKWQHPLGISLHYETNDFLEQVLSYPERVPGDADPSTVVSKVEELADRTHCGRLELKSFLQLQSNGLQPWTALTKDSIHTVIKSSMHNSLALVKLCGPKSAACRIAMKHAVLAITKTLYDEEPVNLVLDLYKAGCEFTPWHVWAFQKQGAPLPEKVFQELRFADLPDPENVWPTISRRGRVNRLSKQDVARITAMARLPHQVGKRTLRIEYVDDVGLGPIVTCPTDQGKMSVGDSSSRFSSSPTAKVEIDVEDEDVSAGERDASAEAGPGCTRDALDDGASVPIRSSSRIAAAAAAADKGKSKEIETVDEELLIVTDWLPKRVQRSDAERQLRAGERWMELLAFLLNMDRMRRKVQARSFAQLSKGYSPASSTGSANLFEKTTPALMTRLERSLDLLRDCLRSGDDQDEEKAVLTQSLLRECLDAQDSLQADDGDMYSLLEMEMDQQMNPERGENTKRRRSALPKRKTFMSARKSFPKEYGPVMAGDLSDDDEEFKPDPKEGDDVDTSEDESSSSDEAADASPPPPPKRSRRSVK